MRGGEIHSGPHGGDQQGLGLGLVGVDVGSWIISPLFPSQSHKDEVNHQGKLCCLVCSQQPDLWVIYHPV